MPTTAMHIGNIEFQILDRLRRKDRIIDDTMWMYDGDHAAIGLKWKSDNSTIDEFSLAALCEHGYVHYERYKCYITDNGIKVLLRLARTIRSNTKPNQRNKRK